MRGLLPEEAGGGRETEHDKSYRVGSIWLRFKDEKIESLFRDKMLVNGTGMIHPIRFGAVSWLIALVIFALVACPTLSKTENEEAVALNWKYMLAAIPFHAVLVYLLLFRKQWLSKRVDISWLNYQKSNSCGGDTHYQWLLMFDISIQFICVFLGMAETVLHTEVFSGDALPASFYGTMNIQYYLTGLALGITIALAFTHAGLRFPFIVGTTIICHTVTLAVCLGKSEKCFSPHDFLV